MLRRDFLSSAALLAAAGAARLRTGALPSLFVGAAGAGAPFRMILLGDCLFTRGLTRSDPSLAPIAALLRSANVTIGNFEGTLADDGAWAGPLGGCGGMNIRGDDAVAGDLAWLGVDMVGTANNHALDWGQAGVLATIRKLNAAGIPNAGLGKDLPEARRAAYHAGSAARTALVAFASTFAAGAQASTGNESGPGRPGLSPLRFGTTGAAPNTSTSPDPRDLGEIVSAVREARRNAEFVVVSCHTHESGPGGRLVPPEFLRTAAKACVDAGADAFLAHGPHVLRGIEMYRGKPIFYSLGAFIFRARETRPHPEEAYLVCQIESRNPLDYFARVSRRWDADTEFWESVVPEIEFDNGKVVGVSLTPTVIQHDTADLWGMPALADAARGHSILERMRSLSERFGTRIVIDGAVGRVVS